MKELVFIGYNSIISDITEPYRNHVLHDLDILRNRIDRTLKDNVRNVLTSKLDDLLATLTTKRVLNEVDYIMIVNELLDQVFILYQSLSLAAQKKPLKLCPPVIEYIKKRLAK